MAALKRAFGVVVKDGETVQVQFTWSWCTWWRPWCPQRRRAWPIHRGGGAWRQSGFPGRWWWTAWLSKSLKIIHGLKAHLWTKQARPSAEIWVAWNYGWPFGPAISVVNIWLALRKKSKYPSWWHSLELGKKELKVSKMTAIKRS